MYWIVFVFFVLLSVLFFVISKLGENTGARGSFVALSGITLIVTGLFVWVDGLVLPVVSSVSNGVFTYVTLTVSVGSDVWAVANLFVFLGVVIILHALVRVVQDMKETKNQKEWDV